MLGKIEIQISEEGWYDVYVAHYESGDSSSGSYDTLAAAMDWAKGWLGVE